MAYGFSDMGCVEAILELYVVMVAITLFTFAKVHRIAQKLCHFNVPL